MMGLGLPNRQWALFTPEEEQAILDLKPSGILVLGYPDSSILTEKISQEAKLWEQLGKPEFLLRVYSDNIIDKNPGEWAETCFRLLSQYEQAHISISGLICANEFNIEHGDEDWSRQAIWLKRFVNVLRPLILGSFIDLHLPALSPSGNYMVGHEVYVAAELSDYFDVIDIHCYNVDQLADVSLADLYGKPTCITEYNRLSPKQVSGYYYILSGDEPDTSLYLLNNPVYYNEFKENQMPFQVGQGIKAAMDKYGEEPQEDEQYLWPNIYSACASDKALYIYSFAANKVYRCPLA